MRKRHGANHFPVRRMRSAGLIGEGKPRDPAAGFLDERRLSPALAAQCSVFGYTLPAGKTDGRQQKIGKT